jgi:hypothetical protein
MFGITIGLALMFGTSQAMSSSEPGFFNICRQYLPMADKFAAQCLAHAREQTRYFNGAPEKHSAYFSEQPIYSHFGLGCVLGATGQIGFMGLYYSTHPESFVSANTAEVRFIDFDGNVGLVANGEPVMLLAIRRFVTDLVPPPFPHNDAKNCEGEENAPEDVITQPQGTFTFSKTLNGNSVAIRSCSIEGSGHPPLCETSMYRSFLGDGSSRIIFNEGVYFDLIQADGGLLIKKDFYEESCHKYYAGRMSMPNIAQELCR